MTAVVPPLRELGHLVPVTGNRRAGPSSTSASGGASSAGTAALDGWGLALAEALDLMPGVWAFLKDRQRRFVWANRALVRKLGLQSQLDLVGLRDEDLWPAHLAEQYRVYEEEVLRRGVRINGMVEFVRTSESRCDGYLSTKLPVRSIAGDVLGLIGIAQPIARHSVPPRQPPAIVGAVALISREFHRRLSLAELAESVAMSPSHFNRSFKREFGATPHKYLRRVRLMAACDLLASTDMPVSIVAVKTGYYDTSHFSNDFLREWRATPSEYRKRFGQMKAGTGGT